MMETAMLSPDRMPDPAPLKSALQVAQSLRIQRPKCLLDDTDLPIALIAERAGFTSPRRMSAAFTHLYGQPPSALRKQQTIRNSLQRTKRVPRPAGAKHL
jgi:AraC-like DNA-binding protein